MINITNIENALLTWASGVAGVPAIIAHPNAPRPLASYVLINLFQTVSVGIEESAFTALPNTSIDVDYSNLEELSISINTYYVGAFQLATKLKDSLARVTVSDQLFAAGLGYKLANSVNEIPEVINQRWEERAQFDCFFYTRSLDEENIETIRKIEITNGIDSSTTIVVKP